MLGERDRREHVSSRITSPDDSLIMEPLAFSVWVEKIYSNGPKQRNSTDYSSSRSREKNNNKKKNNKETFVTSNDIFNWNRKLAQGKQKPPKHSNKSAAEYWKYEEDQGTLEKQLFLLSRSTE